jgi:SAM-dependent methyltransferase
VTRAISDLGPPSKALNDVLDELSGLSQYPVLDAGCGFGRNAVALASRGLSVLCVDQDLSRLQTLVRLAPVHVAELKKSNTRAGKLYPVLADLSYPRWPFAQRCFGVIVCIHFLDIELLDTFSRSLVKNGRLYIETFGGHGGNYLDLPKSGQLSDLLAPHFQLLFYRERKVGPAAYGAVSVMTLAAKI